LARGVATTAGSFLTRGSKEIKAFSMEKFGWSLDWLGWALIDLELAWASSYREYQIKTSMPPVAQRSVAVDATPAFMISVSRCAD
jgi:hypothetical protein